MALCNGLRVAFAAFPASFREPLLNALFHLNIKTSSLDAEIMTELILSGGAAKLLEQKAVLAKERNRIFDRFFPEAVNPGSEYAGCHLFARKLCRIGTRLFDNPRFYQQQLRRMSLQQKKADNISHLFDKITYNFFLKTVAKNSFFTILYGAWKFVLLKKKELLL